MLMHNLAAFTRMKENTEQEAGLDIVCHSVVSSSCSHYIPKFKVNVNCILPVLCKLFEHKFPSTSSYPLKIYIPTELSAENPAQYVCMVITQTLASTVVFYWNFT